MRLVIAIILLAASFSLAHAQPDKGNITFDLRKAAPVVFSHEYHTRIRGVKCAACHFRTFADDSNGFQMKRDKMTKRDFCEHCHNGFKGFDAQSEKNCARCHHK